MALRTLCTICRGEGRYWWVDPVRLEVHPAGLTCEPPANIRKRKICDKCFGVGYMNEPVPKEA